MWSSLPIAIAAATFLIRYSISSSTFPISSHGLPRQLNFSMLLVVSSVIVTWYSSFWLFLSSNIFLLLGFHFSLNCLYTSVNNRGISCRLSTECATKARSSVYWSFAMNRHGIFILASARLWLERPSSIWKVNATLQWFSSAFTNMRVISVKVTDNAALVRTPDKVLWRGQCHRQSYLCYSQVLLILLRFWGQPSFLKTLHNECFG